MSHILHIQLQKTYIYRENYINRKYMINFKTIITITILTFSTILPAMAFAGPLDTSAKDWVYVNGNSWGHNYSPQTQLNTDNVNDLEVKWIFPLEGSSSAGEGVQILGEKQGSTTPPIVRDGKVFTTTNFLKTYAIDAKTGERLWAYTYDIDVDEVSERLPIRYGGAFGGILQTHLHGFRYWETGNALIFMGLACDFYGVDADSGENTFWIKDLCVDIPGNMYDYQQGAVSQTNIGTYEAGRQFVVVLPGVIHSQVLANGDFRHTTIGVDMDTHDILWRVYSFPPHQVLSKDWALQECNTGWFRDIPCSTVAAQAPENLEWDWAEPNEPPSIHGGVTANWGELVIDEDTGYMYTQTGNQGPYTYIGETPGPRLYGSTIMAIDMNAGQRVWWSQPMPRDPYDYDCNWGGILADHPTLGKIYMKGCKEGLLHILDASDGSPIHIIDVVDEQYLWGQIGIEGTLEFPEGGIKYHKMDPLSHYDMREMLAPDGSRYCGDPCNLYPHWSNGLFATDMSYDPETNTLYHYAAGLQRNSHTSGAPPFDNPTDCFSCTGVTSSVMNTTIVARDVVTGAVLWTWFYEHHQQRSQMVVSHDLLFSGFKDGFMRYFDKNTGELLREMNLGSDITVGVTTGQDSDGNQKIFAMLGVGGNRISPATPGTLIAIGLNERAQQAVTTTVTSATTTTTTSTIATTNTVSVTSEVEVGISSTVTYAAIAVAVIAVIAAVVLTQRKQ